MLDRFGSGEPKAVAIDQLPDDAAEFDTNGDKRLSLEELHSLLAQGPTAATINATLYAKRFGVVKLNVEASEQAEDVSVAKASRMGSAFASDSEDPH